MCTYLKAGFLLRITTDNMETYSMVTESMMSNSIMTTNSMMTTDNVITTETNDNTSTNKEVEIGKLTETCNKGKIFFSVAVPVLSSLLGFVSACCMCLCSCYIQKGGGLAQRRRNDNEQEITRKSRRGKKKKDDHVNTLVRETNIECESVISGLREETAEWAREKDRIRRDTLRRVGGGPISVSTQALLPDV